ncbi:Inositol polyphosphate-5-phosphatase [Dirofilaria immitis]
MPDYIKQVTVTGDVSTITNNDDLLHDWCAEVAKEVWEQKPEFAIIHIQGLRNADNPDILSNKILKSILYDAPEVQNLFKTSRSYFDTRETGLGSIYLFRNHDEVESFDRYSNSGYKSLRPGHQYEIGARECDGFISNTFGSASSSASNYSLRYEGDFYRNDSQRNERSDGTKSVQTGYLMSRFRIYGRDFTFVNLSLHTVPFEDIKELVEQPETTKAARLRRSQIDLLLKEIESEGLKDDSVLVAGAFNAQLFETHLLSDMASTQRATSYAKKSSDGRLEGIEQRDRHGRSVLTVETHRFDLHSIHDWFFRLGRGQMVKKYNGELAQVVFGGKLLEESVFFQPSRHYGIAKATGKEEFMKNLCPAWADRVLYNEKLSDLFRHDSFCASGLYYGLVAEKKFVGQHKPVALHATICLK